MPLEYAVHELRNGLMNCCPAQHELHLVHEAAASFCPSTLTLKVCLLPASEDDA